MFVALTSGSSDCCKRVLSEGLYGDQMKFKMNNFPGIMTKLPFCEVFWIKEENPGFVEHCSPG